MSEVFCPAVSIIVPVYNVEKYLEKCVDSILAQTFTDYEVILVDDGSTDGSGVLCDTLAGRSDKIRVIHKKNGGLSDARNAGIDAARGEYLGFIDSDDYIMPDMYETLYRLITLYAADVSVCGVMHEYTNKMFNPYEAAEEKVVSNQEAIAIALEGNKFSVHAVNKLYRKSIFAELRFPKGKQSEDAFVMIKLLDSTSKVAYTTVPKYFYVHRENSITTSSYKARDWDVVEAYTENYKFVTERYPQLKKHALCRYYWAYFYVLDKMCLSEDVPPEERRRALHVLRKGYVKIITNPFLTLSRKAAASVLLINYRLYRYIVLKKSRTALNF